MNITFPSIALAVCCFATSANALGFDAKSNSYFMNDKAIMENAHCSPGFFAMMQPCVMPPPVKESRPMTTHRRVHHSHRR